jgi:hypothetical protein
MARPRKLTDEQIAHVRDAQNARRQLREALLRLPRLEQLAAEWRVSVSLLKLAGRRR